MTTRRGRAGVLALALGIVALAACGDDDTAGTGPSTTAATTTSASTTTAPAAPDDLTAAVDQLCAKTDQIQELLASMGVTEGSEMDPDQQQQVSALATEAVQLMLPLQGSLAQMVPGDASRFQECAAVLGVSGGAPGG